MSVLKGRALPFIILFLFSACVMAILVVWQQRGKGDRRLADETAGDALPAKVKGDKAETGEMAGDVASTGIEVDVQVTVSIAGEALPLIFEGVARPQDLKSTIAADLERVLAYLDDARFEELNRRSRLSRKNEDLEVTHRLVTKGPAPDLLPGPLKRDFGEAVKSDSRYTLLVRRAIIEEYVRAVEFKEKHPDMFGRLDDFIDLLNDQERLKEISRDWETCADYVYRFRGVSKENALRMVRLYASLKDRRVRYPSLLEIGPLSDYVADAPEDSYIMASVVEQKELGARRIGKVALGVYLDGKWLIFTYNPP